MNGISKTYVHTYELIFALKINKIGQYKRIYALAPSISSFCEIFSCMTWVNLSQHRWVIFSERYSSARQKDHRCRCGLFDSSCTMDNRQYLSDKNLLFPEGNIQELPLCVKGKVSPTYVVLGLAYGGRACEGCQG